MHKGVHLLQMGGVGNCRRFLKMSIFRWIFLLRILFLEILCAKELNLVGWFVFIAEYKILCPGGEGFRPNPITVILEGNSVSFIIKCTHFEPPWVYL